MLKIGNLSFETTPLFLAPMEDVTDASFRLICKELGAHVVISEFASSEALIRDVKQTQQKLKFTEQERPFGIQLFGNQMEAMCEAARIAEEYHPDFIDINWGCPVKKIAGKGAGAGMLQNTSLLLSITKELVKSVKTPVTVKTRLGWDEQHQPIVELARQLQDVGIQALTIHGRTRAMMYKGVADWTLIGKIKENPYITIPIIGNGDITNPEKALLAKQRYHVDGIMIGRAAIGNPWIFQTTNALLAQTMPIAPPALKERLAICRRHFDRTMDDKGEWYGMLTMRKHYKHYFKDLNDFKEIRIKLLTSTSVEEIKDIFMYIESKYESQE
jgi:nifR3 family TIM-barrel protein